MTSQVNSPQPSWPGNGSGFLHRRNPSSVGWVVAGSAAGVVSLFCSILVELGYRIVGFRHRYPDCEARRLVDQKRKLWAGCRVEFFHSTKPWVIWVINHRNHRRVLVVDGAVGFTGSAGFADQWRGDADSPGHWRDTQVRVEGPAVRGLQRAFQENWSEVTGEPLVGDEFFPALAPSGSSSAAVVPSSPLAAMSGASRVYAISLAAASNEVSSWPCETRRPSP